MKKRVFYKTKFYFVSIFLGVVLMTSCSPEYIPNMVNSPMFSNQGEFQATIATGTSNFDMQTAYAVTDHIGIMLNGSYGNQTSDSSDNYHKHAFIEGGMGYYNKIGSKGRYEIYGGFGTGKVDGLYENNLFSSQITDATFNRVFVQPGIGISTGIYDGSFSPRFVLVQMNPNGADFKTGDYNTFFEPVVTSKIGFKYVKFVFQFGFSVPMGNQNFNYDYQPFIFNVGINLNLGRLYDF